MHSKSASFPSVASVTFVAAAALAVGVIPAQTNTFVSPVSAATVEGSASNGFPWNSTTSRRYMQIHGDTILQPMAITKLSWRRDGGAASGTAARTADIELFMGLARDWESVSYVLSDNYLVPPTRVIARRIVNMGPHVGGSPAPFSLDAVLDAPYGYGGGLPLIWEAHVHSLTLPTGSSASIDVDAAPFTVGSTSITGSGCIASGNTAEMTHVVSTGDMGGTLTFGFTATNAPPNALAFLAIGATNPNLPVPGLCGPLYTELALMLQVGLTDGSGQLGTTLSGLQYPSGRTAFSMPNRVQGATIYTQLHAVDVGSSLPIAIVGSNGRMVTFPFSNTSKVVKVTRLFNNTGGTTATDALFFHSSTVGYGAVTQFTY
jgi:hypothetical protein